MSITGTVKEDPYASLKREWFEGLKKGAFNEGKKSCGEWLKARTAEEKNALKDAVDDKSISKNMSIHYAALNNDLELIETLFNMAADMTITNKLGSTALHLACVAGSTEAVKILVKYSRDPESPNTIQNTPIHCAVLSGNLDTLQALINGLEDKYADDDEFNLRAALKTPNLASFTPGMYAVYNDDIKKYLLKLMGSS